MPSAELRVLALCVGMLLGQAVAAGPFKDPVDTPAAASAMAAAGPLLAIASAGERVVGVGQRGHIVYSDDRGQHWAQARVPVSSDLVAVSFPTPKAGWAVGHGGVVLHSADGGQTWVRQLDGRQAARLAMEHYGKAGDAVPEAVLRQAKGQLDDAQAGAPAPFLDVLFESETTGFVVGAFNRIFRTEDGGKSWTPWMERVDNPEELHLYAIRGSGDQRYMVGERGKAWRLDVAARRFVAVPTPYDGTLFGAVVTPASVVAYGMNGTAFRSVNHGRAWEKVAIGSRAGITGGDVLAGGRIVLVNYAGELLLSDDQGKTFVTRRVAASMPSYYGAARLGERELGVAGINGVKVMVLP